MRLLLADDSMTILKVVGSFLKQQGFEVITASDGVEATIKASTQKPDLILLDVIMPKMNGYQVCRLLKNQPATAHIPIIILTSKDQPREKFWGYQTGADEFVTKGFDQTPLLEAVKRHLPSEKEVAATCDSAEKLVENEFDILARSNDLLDAKLFEATIVNEIGKLASSLQTLEETASALFALLANLTGYEAGLLAFSHGEQGVILSKISPGVGKDYLNRFRHYLEARLKNEHPESIPPGGYDLEILDRAKTGIVPEVGKKVFDPGRIEAVFLRSKGKVIGMLAITAERIRPAKSDREILELFASHGTMVLENAWLYEQVRRLSIMDGLTKVYNRRYIEERIREEINLSQRHKTNLSVIMLDVDFFKKVNDTYGHQAGDEVLKHLMVVCRSVTRATDILGRYGGEEFVVVLPETNIKGAEIVAERIRAAVGNDPFPTCAGRIPVTISLGLASIPSRFINSAEVLIKAADLALYRAKRSGRNRACCYDPGQDGYLVDNE